MFCSNVIRLEIWYTVIRIVSGELVGGGIYLNVIAAAKDVVIYDMKAGVSVRRR